MPKYVIGKIGKKTAAGYNLAFDHVIILMGKGPKNWIELRNMCDKIITRLQKPKK